MSKIGMEDIKNLELFKNLDGNIQKELCEKALRIKLEKGKHLFREREKVNTIYIVLKGKVSLYRISEDAQKRIIFILGENSIINEVILDDVAASINCEGFEEAIIMGIKKEDFLNAMSRDFNFTKKVINSMSKKIRRCYRQIKNTVAIKVDKRVAAKLWKLSKDYGVEREEGTEIALNITVTYLADMFGSPRETISRALRTLENEGLIQIKNRKFIIKNRDALAKYFKGV
ncbi:Crp/Fnr family transcriptional regulator [Desnuesiella massiliensis]|uniref:Crp/Fnr family transcriptional regulator n=1 Tax=Desnuesiella massiliensis TaxID=1650662 RepID=UPI0006E3E4DB|nr:Crp/Fnr family transcriptional regulator [Desnuesiella massiliensis]